MYVQVRTLVAVTCFFILIQCFLNALFFLFSSSSTKLRAESKNGVGSRSSDVHQCLEAQNRNGSKWQDENGANLKEEVSRDLLERKMEEHGFQAFVRNTSKTFEMLRLLLDSDLRSNQSQFRNDSVDYSHFGNSSQMNVKIRPLNPLEEYFLRVQKKRADIRNAPNVNNFDFRYVINPGNKTCAAQQVFLFAFVPTAVEHYGFRRVIRNTWAVTNDFRLPVRRVFVVGRPAGKNANRLQQLVELESRNFGDIVQADFLDTYDNLTYKVLAGLRWTAMYCNQARYVLKIDDDTFVNMFALLDWLERDAKRSSFFTVSSSSSSSLFLPSSSASYSSDLALFGRVVRSDKVHRTGKWAIPESKFRYVYYPPYCSGPAYVLTRAMATQVVSDSLHVPFFRLEDVYVTGFVTMLAGDSVRFVQWNYAFVSLRAFSNKFLQSRYRFNYNYLFAPQIDNHKLYMSVWFQMRQFYIKGVIQSADTRKQTHGHGRQEKRHLKNNRRDRLV